jgi:formylglycine-generating enzyme required for sulfatase activity
LWRWAVKPFVTLPPGPGLANVAAQLEWKPSPQETFYSYAIQRIVEIHTQNSAERNTAQQVRLPMVAQIVEHRAAQRHIFDVLKLLQTLASAMGATNSNPHELVFEPYRSLLAEVQKAAVTVDQTAAGSQLPAQNERTRIVLRNVKELVGDLVSEDTAAQANMASRHEFRPGHVLDEGSVADLIGMLESTAKDVSSKRRVLNGLKFLAPYVTKESGGGLWKIVEDCVNLQTEPNPKLRALWGDVRAALGADPRFETTGLCFAKKDVDDKATRFNTFKDEIAGFVRIDARTQPFWFGDGFGDSPKPVLFNGIGQPFYMSRTLTTVAQYARFLESYTYKSHFIGDGKTWLSVAEEVWRRENPALVFQFNYPYGWREAGLNLLWPAFGVGWFEAAAYIHWLNAQLPQHGLGAYRATLPTELQWECAARFGSDVNLPPRLFPFQTSADKASQRVQVFEQYANLGELVGSPTTVGLYPKGNSPMNLTDMSGNVTEWMSDQFVEGYDPNAVVEAQNPTKKMYSFRGGSWSHDPVSARCSARGGSTPDDYDLDLGFRVVLSRAN